MEYLNDRWAEVGKAVTEAVQATGVPLAQVAVRAGVSDKFIRALMAGTRRRYGPKTAALGAVFGWKPDWLARLLGGEHAVTLRFDATELALMQGRVSDLGLPKPQSMEDFVVAVELSGKRLDAMQADLRRLEALILDLAKESRRLGVHLDADDEMPGGATPDDQAEGEGPQ